MLELVILAVIGVLVLPIVAGFVLFGFWVGVATWILAAVIGTAVFCFIVHKPHTRP